MKKLIFILCLLLAGFLLWEKNPQFYTKIESTDTISISKIGYKIKDSITTPNLSYKTDKVNAPKVKNGKLIDKDPRGLSYTFVLVDTNNNPKKFTSKEAYAIDPYIKDGYEYKPSPILVVSNGTSKDYFVVALTLTRK